MPTPRRSTRVVRRGVSIESPPPQASAVRATSYDALAADPRRRLLRPAGARRRIVVVLTDGESAPVQTGDIAAAFAATPGYQLALRPVLARRRGVFDADGRAEPATGPTVRRRLARLARLGARRQRVRRERRSATPQRPQRSSATARRPSRRPTVRTRDAARAVTAGARAARARRRSRTSSLADPRVPLARPETRRLTKLSSLSARRRARRARCSPRPPHGPPRARTSAGSASAIRRTRTRHSPLTQITHENVDQLGRLFTVDFRQIDPSIRRGQQSYPVESNGTLYVTTNDDNVFAARRDDRRRQVALDSPTTSRCSGTSGSSPTAASRSATGTSSC